MSRRRNDWELEDEWHEHGWHARHVPARNEFLVPAGGHTTSSLRRSRSTGARPQPNIHIHNTMRNDMETSRSPPRGRDRHRFPDEEVIEAIDDLRHDIRRGRSRGPPVIVAQPPPQAAPQPQWRDPSPFFGHMQMELARERERSRFELERERERLEAELDHDRLNDRAKLEAERELMRTRAEIRKLKDKLAEEEREALKEADAAKFKREIELEKLRDDTQRRADEARRRDDRERFLMEREREDREKERAAKLARLQWEKKEEEEEEERKRILNEYKLKEDKKKKETDAAEAAAIAAYQKKQADEKKKREDMIKQIKREEEEAAEKAKAEKELWRLKLEKEKADEEAKKKKHQAEIDEELRKKLAKIGFQDNQVEAILDPKKAQAAKPGLTPANPIHYPHGHSHAHHGSSVVLHTNKPTYIRIHRNHIDVETLRYYGLPWEYDHHDTNFIVIMQEIDQEETEILFEHTRKLRKGASTLLIEERGSKRDPKFAFVRRRPSASPSRRRRSSPKRVSVNLGLFG